MRKRRILIGGLAVLALLLATGGYLYAFGTPQAPSGPAAGAVASAGAIAADVPAPDPNSPLAVQIPGCVCHSDDPELVQQHATYRMNQCVGCHAGGMPENMGR
ncbi:MAG: hypothetical protein Q8K99_12375 [Actinomycetota bacterium]|nr:hypothetical protein [Actinomycetota bacterium]